jgi:hypothetical protein
MERRLKPTAATTTGLSLSPKPPATKPPATMKQQRRHPPWLFLL